MRKYYVIAVIAVLAVGFGARPLFFSPGVAEAGLYAVAHQPARDRSRTDPACWRRYLHSHTA